MDPNHLLGLIAVLAPYDSRSCDFGPKEKKTTKSPPCIGPFALLAPKVNFDSVYADVAPTSQ